MVFDLLTAKHGECPVVRYFFKYRVCADVIKAVLKDRGNGSHV